MSKSEIPLCHQHSGIDAKIMSLEKIIDSVKEDTKAMTDKIDKKITKIYVLLLTVLGGLAANMALLYLKSVS